MRNFVGIWTLMGMSTTLFAPLEAETPRPPAEQRAFAYARELTKAPSELTPADYKAVEADLGPGKAMGTFFWLCRGLYMTRVSDGFQLPLERENVFMDFFQVKPRAASR